MSTIYQTKTTVQEWYGSSVTIPAINSPKFVPFASSCLGIAISLLDKKTNKKINVGLSSSIDTAYADPDKELIVISEKFLSGDFSAIGANSKLNAPKTVGAVLGVIVHEIGHFAYSPKNLLGYTDFVSGHTTKVFDFTLARTLANTLEDIYIEYQISRLAPTLEWTLAEINRLMLTDAKYSQTIQQMKSVNRPDGKIGAIMNFLLFAKVVSEARKTNPFASKLFRMARSVTKIESLSGRIDLCLALYELIAPDKPKTPNAPILPKNNKPEPTEDNDPEPEDDSEPTEPEDANDPTEDEELTPNAESGESEDKQESDDPEDEDADQSGSSEDDSDADYNGSEDATEDDTDDLEPEDDSEDESDEMGDSEDDTDDTDDPEDEPENDPEDEDDSDDQSGSGSSSEDEDDSESEDESDIDPEDEDQSGSGDPEDDSEDDSEPEPEDDSNSELGNDSEAIPQIDTFQTRETMPIPDHTTIQTDLGYKPSLDGHIVIESTIQPDAANALEMDKRYTKLSEMARQRTNANVGYGEQKSRGRDLRQIYRIVTDQKIFSTRVQQQTVKPMEVIILLDCSGSMGLHTTGMLEDKLMNASRAVLGAATGLLEGKCLVSVFGHTSDPYNQYKQLLIYRLFNQGESVNLLARRLYTLNFPNRMYGQRFLYYNRDGYAIYEICKKFQSQNRKRILIVISDGAPNGDSARYSDSSSYDGMRAIDHTKLMVDRARQSGIGVYSISIDQSAYAANNYIYGKEFNTCAPDANAIDTLIRQLYK